MSARRMVKKGFTLVEILIVVVILGILAAIVIPQFTNASTTARAGSLQSQLQTIRAQLELYRVQHNDIYPNMIADGNVWTDLTVAAGGFGPYLQAAPINPFTNTSDMSAAGNTAWRYTDATGVLLAAIPQGVVNPLADANADGLEDTIGVAMGDIYSIP